jgi:anti-sigma factor RsiW
MAMPMRLFSFRRSHARFTAAADAYVDGELRDSESRRFEAHLTGCARCQALVSEARALKSALVDLPELEAPRSFALTPAMLAAQPSGFARAVIARTPAYMYAMRGIAAAAVAVFAVVAISGLNGGGSERSASSPERQTSLSAAEAPRDNSAKSATDSSQAAAVPSAPGLAGSSGGGVSGQSAATTPAVTPAASGAQAATPPAPQPGGTFSADSTPPEALGEAITAPPAAAHRANDNGNDVPWTAISAGIALIAVAGLLVLEVRRRKAR